MLQRPIIEILIYCEVNIYLQVDVLLTNLTQANPSHGLYQQFKSISNSGKVYEKP